MQQTIYKIDDEKLLKASPSDVICFLSCVESMNGNAFLSFFNYFSNKLEVDNLTVEQQYSIAQYLYEMTVNCQEESIEKSNPFNDRLPIVAKCVGRKLVLRDYLSPDYKKDEKQKQKLL